MPRSVTYTVLLSILATQAFPADAHGDCSDPEDQQSMNYCADQAFKVADRKLNQSYAKLYKSASPEGKEKLKKAETAWIVWRDAQCVFDTSSTDTYSALPMVYAMCLENLTRDQTKRLDSESNCTEGDVSCHSK